MLAEFYSRIQNPKESVKEFGESLLQIARKIMTAKPEFKVDIENTLKARFADGLRDHYHQAMAREMIRSCPTFIFCNKGLRSACAHGEVYTLLIASFYIHK